MHAQDVANVLITLTEAAKITPGRPSTNCLWRWCRRGVLSRGGKRVRLEHRRIGGKIFTAPDWLEDFGRRLAEADTQHFDLCREVAAEAIASERRTARNHRQPKHGSHSTTAGMDRVHDAERELDEMGIQ